MTAVAVLAQQATIDHQLLAETIHHSLIAGNEAMTIGRRLLTVPL